MPLSVDPLRWLQSMSSRTNVASNTITVHLISSIHLSAFLSSPVWSKLAELSFKIRQHLTIFATWRHLWFHFSLGVPALNCKYPQNGADWLKNMSFLVIPIYWRHSVLTSQSAGKPCQVQTTTRIVFRIKRVTTTRIVFRIKWVKNYQFSINASLVNFDAYLIIF